MALESTYERRGSANLWWYNKASDFRGAVAAIEYITNNNPDSVRDLCNLSDGYDFRVALIGPFLLNAGLSLELLLKAIIVLNLKGDFKRLPPTHNLLKLAEVANIAPLLTSDQKATLAVFSEAVFWEGKYPVPKGEDEYSKNSKLWNRMRRPVSGQTGKLIITEANPDTWPSLENYNAI